MQGGGFTLIELSIVLVIIGLVVGGVLVGKDLIRAAEIRKAVSQLEKYNTAISTFRLKFNALPGDMTNAAATSFGLTARVGNAACGNADGYIASMFANEGATLDGNDFGDYGNCGALGDESQLFWLDLQRAGLIADTAGLSNPATTVVEKMLPKLPMENAFVVAANGGSANRSTGLFGYYFMNYQQGVSQFDAAYNPGPSLPGLSIASAQAMDAKIDDGNPVSGRVYTLDDKPGLGAVPNRGIDGTCSVSGGGINYYDVQNDQPNVCNLKALSSGLK